MAGAGTVGLVGALWRFPVKSMQGEQVQSVDVTDVGVLGDRAYALVDMATGKVASAKSVKTFPDILKCSAAFLGVPRHGEAMPAALITLPDGRTVRTDDPAVDAVLSGFFERRVSLSRVSPDNYFIDQYHPDVEGADPGGKRDVTVDLPLGASLFAALGQAPAIPVGSFLDFFPMTVLTTSTLDSLADTTPGTRFDARRFRMNLIIETPAPGFVENDWVGHTVTIGASTQLEITMPDPRCVTTTLAQADLPQDAEVLRAMVKHNRIPVPGLGVYPCAGVYAVVVASGTVNVGDQVVVQQ